MFKTLKSKLLAGSALLAPVLTFAEGETNTVTIPDAGIDLAGYVTQGITVLGGVAAVVVGGYFCFLLIRKGMKWASRLG